MTRTNRRTSLCLAAISILTPLGAALAGPLPASTIRQMIAMTDMRLQQTERVIRSVTSLLEMEYRHQAWLAEYSQQNRWTAEQYGHELGLSFQRIAELTAEQAGAYAVAASLRQHLSNLYLEIGEVMPDCTRPDDVEPSDDVDPGLIDDRAVPVSKPSLTPILTASAE